MTTAEDEWTTLVEAEFGFLRERGYRLHGGAHSGWETWIQYVSEHNAIRVIRSVEFLRAEVLLIRLVDGLVPSPGAAHRGNSALLDNIAELRGAGPIPTGGWESSDMPRQLAEWAKLLRQLVPDFLDGDCAVIDDVAVMIRERVQRRPWPPPSDPRA